jgi:1-deoxy-D-xylulose-5-phosphate synthase
MLRFPRGRSGKPIRAVGRLGSAELLTDTDGDADVLLLPVGPMAAAALEASRCLSRLGVKAAVVDPRWISPVDQDLVRFARRHRLVVTIEDNALAGGFGDALARALRVSLPRPELLTLGLPGDFIQAGERDELLSAHGLDAAGISLAVSKAFGARP